eukprot:jgi/Botrbrau1/15847/Bobra.40_1s0031.1
MAADRSHRYRATPFAMDQTGQDERKMLDVGFHPSEKAGFLPHMQRLEHLHQNCKERRRLLQEKERLEEQGPSGLEDAMEGIPHRIRPESPTLQGMPAEVMRVIIEKIGWHGAAALCCTCVDMLQVYVECQMILQEAEPPLKETGCDINPAQGMLQPDGLAAVERDVSQILELANPGDFVAVIQAFEEDRRSDESPWHLEDRAWLETFHAALIARMAA